MPASETRPGLRAVRLDLTPQIHKMLRKLAADREPNMALLARQIVSEYIVTHAPKGGGK
jgi:hypothetical protein